MWPSITNDRQLSPGEMFAAYRWQPNLEKCHAQLKGTQLVAPMWLRDPARIEGLLTCHFIAMLLSSPIERTNRQAMIHAGLSELSLYPSTAAAPRPPPPASSRSSPASPATSSPTPTGPCCAPSTPSSPSSNATSSTCSTSPPASTTPSRECR